MTTRIGDPPPPHFRIGRSVQRLEKPLITMQSEDGSEITSEGYQSSDFLRTVSGFPARLAALLCRGRLAAGLYPRGGVNR
jgi:hypothetical protein